LRPEHDRNRGQSDNSERAANQHSHTKRMTDLKGTNTCLWEASAPGWFSGLAQEGWVTRSGYHTNRFCRQPIVPCQVPLFCRPRRINTRCHPRHHRRRHQRSRPKMLDSGPSLPAPTRGTRNRKRPIPSRVTAKVRFARSPIMETGHLRLTGIVYSAPSELATAQRARPTNPG
jgi:hypothetical protein